MAAQIDHYRSRSNGMYCMHSTENFPHRPRKRLPAASPQISQKTRLEPTTNLPGKREKRMSPLRILYLRGALSGDNHKEDSIEQAKAQPNDQFSSKCKSLT